jgi:hypothetical protein
VAKAAESNENLKKALEVEEDGDFTFDDMVDDSDPELADK